MILSGAIVAATSSVASEIQPEKDLRLHMTGQGRFAYFADLDSIAIAPDGTVTMRSLQISHPMKIGEHTYIGGWSLWAFDCRANTARRANFASLRSDGITGPVTPVNDPTYEMVSGGDAAELGAVACGNPPMRVDASTLVEAVALSAED